MKLKWMSFKNFRLFKQNHIDLSGVTLASIIGRYTNNWSRSNEAGKSTIGEALMYLLFDYKNTTSLDELVTWGYESEGLEVSGEFEYEGQLCRLKRSWTPRTKGVKGNFEFHLNGERQGKHQAEAKKMFSKFIGIDANIAFATWYFLQGKADKLTTSDPSERKEYLASVLKAEYSGPYEVAKKKLKETQQQLDVAQISKNEINDIVQKIEEANNTITVAIAEEKRLSDEEQKVIGELSEVSRKLGEHKERQRAAENLPKFQDELSKIDEWLVHVVKKAEEAVATHTEKTKALETIDARHAELKRKSDEVAAAIAKIKSECSSRGFGDDESLWVSKVQTNLNEIKMQMTELTRRKSENEKSLQMDWSGKTQCPTCGQQATPEHLQSHISQLSASNAEIDQQYMQLNSKASEAQESVNSMLLVVAEFKRLQSESYKITTDNMSHDQDLETCQQAVTFAKQIVDQLKSEFDQHTARRATVVADIEQIVQFAEWDHTSILEEDEGRLKQQQQTLVEGRMQQSTSITQWKQHLETLTQKKTSLDGLISQMPELEKKVNIQSAIVELFHRDGLALMKIKQAAGLIQLHANQMLSDVLQNYTIKVVVDSRSGKRGVLDFRIMTNTGEHSYASFSGGARKVIDICLRMSLAKILAEGSGRTFRTLFLDEVMADLDEVNREAMMKLIRTLSRSFASIYVISHEKEIQTAFPQVVLVERDGESSQLSVMETSSVQ
jgi:DNA repair exonuclease SbcCD ATPase subunit